MESAKLTTSLRFNHFGGPVEDPLEDLPAQVIE